MFNSRAHKVEKILRYKVLSFDRVYQVNCSCRLLCGACSDLLKKFTILEMKWNRLEVRVCESLLQDISIPEMDVEEVLPHRYYLQDGYDGENAVIFVSPSGQKFMNIILGESLEEYFGVEGIATKIDKILSTPLDDLEELLRDLWKVQELPPSWKERLYGESDSEDSASESDSASNEEPPDDIVSSLYAPFESAVY